MTGSFADRIGKGVGGEDPSQRRGPGKGRRKGSALCLVLVKQLVSAAHQEAKALPFKLASLFPEHHVQFKKKFIFILPISSCEEDVCQGFESPTHFTVAVQYRLQCTIMGSSKSLVGGTCLLLSVQN